MTRVKVDLCEQELMSNYGEPAKETSFSANMMNPIRDLVESSRVQKLIEQAKSSEKKFIPLSIGDPTVFGNLAAPDFLVNEICEKAKDEKCHGYSPSTGRADARQAVAKNYSYLHNKLTAEDVLITSGCSGGIEIALKAILSPRRKSRSKKLLIPDPGFPLYQTICDSYSLPYERYDLDGSNNWECDLVALEDKLRKNVGEYAAIIVNNPANPCGTVYSSKHLTSILQIASNHGLVVLADEIYGDLTYGSNVFTPLASLTTESLKVPVITFGGIAKEFIVPGFRVGWVLFYTCGSEILKRYLENIKEGAKKLCQLILGPCSIIQAALPKILDKSNVEVMTFKKNLRSTLEENGSFFAKRLNSIKNQLGEPVFKVNDPQGSMYAMIEIISPMLVQENHNKSKTNKRKRYDVDIGEDASVWIVERLLEEEHVFFLPGLPFGKNGTNFLRSTITAPMEILAEVCERLDRFAKVYM